MGSQKTKKFKLLEVRIPVMIFILLSLFLRTNQASGYQFSVAVTGDVNFNPNITNYSPEYPYGNLIDTLNGFDILLINHESTSANLNDPSPNDYKYEDPINQTSLLMQAGGVSFAGQSNNHQFDFWDIGVNRTMNVLSQLPSNIQTGGLYETGKLEVDKKEPIKFPISNNNSQTSSSSSFSNIVIFSLVAQLCHKDSSGQDIMDSCTCGIPDNTSSTFSDMPPAQCYLSNNTEPGLWYLSYPLSENDINDAISIIETYHLNYPNDIVIINIHAGPNFEWDPQSDRESLLRRLSDAGADIIWGTSSHHLQRMENRQFTNKKKDSSLTSSFSKKSIIGTEQVNSLISENGGSENDDSDDDRVDYGKPIIFGLGDMLFRFIPGVDKPETCEEGMAPCQRFRPAISVIYEFIFDVDNTTTTTVPVMSRKDNHDGEVEGGRPILVGIRAHPTIHDSMQTQSAIGEDKRWLIRKFNELSMPFGYQMQEDENTQELWIVPFTYNPQQNY